ncbi:MAG: M14 family metallopeptidase [Bacteroidota bacterium]
MKRIFVFFLGFGGFLFGQIPSNYHSYDDLTTSLKKLASQHSHLLTLSSIAKTEKGRELWVVTIGKGNPKKGILIVGGIEATQIVGSEYALRSIEYLVKSYGKVDSITTLLDNGTVYVIPRANPDAGESFFEKPIAERATNYSPYDDDRDGEVDEDSREDINKDGYITWMRIKDPRGEWIVNPDEPRLMRKADPLKGEKGKYQMFTEGVDNDKDEQWNEDEIGGTDLNRNFTHNYHFFGANSGIHQMSEIESKAIADFVFDRQNIVMVYSFSSSDNLTTPWKNEPPRPESRFITSVPKEDEDFFAAFSKQFVTMTKSKNAPKPAKGEGAFSEWAYYHAGRWSLSVRPWWPGEVQKGHDSSGVADSAKISAESKKIGKEKSEDPLVNLLKWYDAAGRKDVALPWMKFSHPDFPDREVEIGGLKPFFASNPPAESINAYSASYTHFITYLLQQLPEVGIRNQKVEKVGGNVYRISVDVVNNGFLPTNNEMGVKTRWVRNVLVVLESGNGVSVTAGKKKQSLGPISGNGGFTTVSWIVVGKGTVTIIAESPTAGRAELQLDLK